MARTKTSKTTAECIGKIHGHGVWDANLKGFRIETAALTGDTAARAESHLKAWQAARPFRAEDFSVQPLYLAHCGYWRCTAAH